MRIVNCFSVYKIPITFLYGTRREIDNWFKRNGHEPLRPSAAGNYRIYESGGGEKAIISLVKLGNAVSEISALAHEVIHVAVYTFGKVGIPIRDPDEEPFTYFVESIIHQCLTGIRSK